MSKKTSLLKWMDEDLKKKVEENLAGHNLTIVAVGENTLYARCLHQEAHPLYTVLAGKKEDVALRSKKYKGISIPTYDKEVAIIAKQ